MGQGAVDLLEKEWVFLQINVVIPIIYCIYYIVCQQQLQAITKIYIKGLRCMLGCPQHHLANIRLNQTGCDGYNFSTCHGRHFTEIPHKSQVRWEFVKRQLPKLAHL